ncbi:MAG: hypothetical protein IKW26_00720 [Treponema sp.]|nr:hypothetical protein [Treponema sp.]
MTKLYKEISSILNTARANAYKAVNFTMVTSYWSIGQLIVEDEQNGNERAEYGKAIVSIFIVLHTKISAINRR